MDASSPPRDAPPDAYVLTRWVLLRLLALVYAVAFLVLIQQQDPLLGRDGILPAERFFARVAARFGSTAEAAQALRRSFGSTPPTRPATRRRGRAWSSRSSCWPVRPTRVAGGLFIAFQVILIASGNLSFLNWLTIVPAIACLDDALLARVLPRRFVARARPGVGPSRGHRIAAGVLVALVAVLSVPRRGGLHSAVPRS